MINNDFFVTEADPTDTSKINQLQINADQTNY